MAMLMSFFISISMLGVPLLATQLGSSDLVLGIIGSAAAGTYALVVVSAGARRFCSSDHVLGADSRPFFARTGH